MEISARLALAAAVLAAVIGCGVEPATAQVTVSEAWVAETPPGAPNGAAYLVLQNAGDADVEVVSATSPVCERVEFHTTDLEGGVARMRMQPSLRVPGGGRLALEPGGTHLMLIATEPLVRGEQVLLTFELADGERLSVEAPVRKPGGGGGGHEHHHH